MRRAAVSVQSNIAEGFGRHFAKELIQFLYISRGSIYEVQQHCLLARDLGYFDKSAADEIISLYEGLNAGVMSFVNRIKQKDAK